MKVFLLYFTPALYASSSGILWHAHCTVSMKNPGYVQLDPFPPPHTFKRSENRFGAMAKNVFTREGKYIYIKGGVQHKITTIPHSY